MTDAVVAGTIRFHRRDCPPRAIERLRRDLSLPNPEYVTRRRLGRYTGATPETIECLAEHPDGTIEIPRGAVSLLRRHLPAVRFHDQRVLHAPLNLQSRVELRPYQLEAVRQMRRHVQGYVVLPCGAGKSVIGISVIAHLQQPALVIVHTRDLLDQWCESIRRLLEIEPGIVGQGKRKLGPVTVATVQTLVRLDDDDLRRLVSQFGCAITDETHHLPASTFQRVLAATPARYRFGLTATPDREDGLSPLIDFTLGARLYTVTYQELVNAGYLEAPEVQYVYSSFEGDFDDYATCTEALIADPHRNQLITDIAAREATTGRHTVLVLSDRVEHCRTLAGLLRHRGVDTAVLVGATPKAERRRILEDFKAGRIPVVVASTLADEGLDVPRLDRVLLAYPGRTQSRITQRLGRLMRPHPDKTQAILFDVVDSAVPTLRRQYLERRRLYKQLVGNG